MDLLFVNLLISFTVYKYIAIVGSILFVVQLVLSLTGLCPFKVDPVSKGDFAITRHRSKLLLGRSIIGFIFGFGWVGVYLFERIQDKTQLDLITFVCALVITALLYPVLKAICRMSERHAFVMEDALEKVGEVYIRIPAKDEGVGKILVSVRGIIREHEAITFEKEGIEKGKIVTIVGIEDSILIVRPF